MSSKNKRPPRILIPRADWTKARPAARTDLLLGHLDRAHPDQFWLSGSGDLIEIQGLKLLAVTKPRFHAALDDAVSLESKNGAVDLPYKAVSHAFSSVRVADGRPRTLLTIANQPFYAPGPRLVGVVGYDDDTKTWQAWERLDDVSACCCPGGCDGARCPGVLGLVLSSSFADRESELHALMALIGLYLTSAAGAPGPGYLVTAKEEAAGKSYFTAILSEVGTGGGPGAAMVGTRRMADNPQELRWKLASAVAKGNRIITIDNLPKLSVFGDDEIAMFLTATVPVEIRAVGRPAISVDFRGRTLFFTGIGVELDLEMGRRLLTIRLQRPSRYREPEPLSWISKHRDAVHFAVIREIGRWLDAGAPPPPRLHPSYPAWSRIVAGAACFIRPDLAEFWQATDRAPTIEDDIKALKASWPCDEAGEPRLLLASEVLQVAIDGDLHRLLLLWSSKKGPTASAAGRWLGKRADFSRTTDGHSKTGRYRPRQPGGGRSGGCGGGAGGDGDGVASERSRQAVGP